MNNKRILCAMSGGVDSSVAALLLKKKGYEVIGAFLNFWSDCNHKKNNHNRCCSPESLNAARMAAQKLGIKLYVLNLEKIFKKKVVNYYIESYENGETPNPCVVCNQQIKFGKLLQIARGLGLKEIATGHYAVINKREQNYELWRGRDKKRDQSYFLWRINLSDLSRIKFPVGRLLKKEVRQIAKKENLGTYLRKESRGVCFIGQSNISFLRKFAKKLLDPGDVVDKSSQVIGKHKGLSLYTIGQRGEFTLTKDKWRQSGRDVPPLFVKGFNIKRNQLIVGLDKSIYRKKLVLCDLSWLDKIAARNVSNKKGFHCHAQIRYQHKAKSCQVLPKKNLLLVKFKKPQRAITPGQSCVLYLKNKVLGGGIISNEN